MSAQPPRTLAEKQLALGAALGFSDADLVDNRAGQLSDAQKLTLSAGNRWRFLLLILEAAVLVRVAAPFVPGLREALFFAGVGNETVGRLGFYTVLIPLLVLGLIFTAYQLWRRWRDICEGHVEAVRGIAKVTNPEQATLILRVGGVRYYIGEAVVHVEDGQAYELYVLPRTQRVVGAKVLDTLD